MKANGFYTTRREQLLDEAKSKQSREELAFAAALIGAAAERDRAITILRKRGLHEAALEIIEMPIDDLWDLEEDDG